MLQLLRAKFTQNARLETDLLATGTKKIAALSSTQLVSQAHTYTFYNNVYRKILDVPKRGSASTMFVSRGVARIWEGGQEIFFQIWKPCALLRGFGGMPHPKNIFLNGAIWCVLVCILIRFCL